MLVRLSAPVFAGKIIHRTMASKAVTQYTCDRCKRVWYEDAGVEQAREEQYVEVTATLGTAVFDVSFECLCVGCASTVKGLLESVTKSISKASPIRGAKKTTSEAKEEPPATDVASAKPAARPHVISVEPASAQKVPAPSNAAGGSPGGKSSQPVPPGAPPHPTKS